MTWGWGATSQERLDTVNPGIVAVLNLAREKGCPELTIPPFGGSRNLAQQRELVGGGTSWTLNSKHRVDEPGHLVGRVKSDAVDVAPWPIDWEDLLRFQAVSGFILGAAHRLDIRLEWGGLWLPPTKKDWGHYEFL